MRIATVGEVTDRHTDAGKFIICPMLCYSSGTDNVYCTVGYVCHVLFYQWQCKNKNNHA